MRITIIPVDSTVIKDDQGYQRLDLSSCNIPANIHALQFINDSGFLEFNDGSPNQDISTLPNWANACISIWDAADYKSKNPAAPTPEELIANCKSLAKNKLQTTDWSVLPDVGLKNQAEFVTYRGILRNYVFNPVENPSFPVEPTPIWN